MFDCFRQHTSTNTSCPSSLVKLDTGPTKVSNPKDSRCKPKAALPRHFVKRSLGFSTPFRKAKINLLQATRSFNHSMRISKCLLLRSVHVLQQLQRRLRVREQNSRYLFRAFLIERSKHTRKKFSQARHLLRNRLESQQLTFHA